MISLLHWHTEPFLIGGLLLIGWIYAMLVGPMRARLFAGAPGGAPVFPRQQSILFGLGLLSLYLAVGSPLDALGENFLFCAHMAQHNVLMYVSPLLMLLGLPHWMIDTALIRSGSLYKATKFWCRPVVAGAAFTLVFSVWHVPSFYDAALHNKSLHVFEHLTMVAVSFLMWWPIASPSRLLPPISRWSQCLFVFALMVAQTPVFGILVFSGDVLYPTYAFAPRIVDLSPIEDQVLGGVVMKLANMSVSLMIIGRAFLGWAYSEERGLRAGVLAGE